MKIERIKAIYPLLFLALAIMNFVVSCRIIHRQPEVVHHYETVTNVVESVSISNFIEKVSSSGLSTNILGSAFGLSSPSSAVSYEPKCVAKTSYQYYLVGRRCGVLMYGRRYFDGSLCSYGRIDKVFPDRILLSNGDWIENDVRFEFGYAKSSKEKRSNND